MAKISELPAVQVPTGDELVVVVDGGRTARVAVGPLARAAVASAIDGAVGGFAAMSATATLARRDLHTCQRVDDLFHVPAYAAVQFYAAGADFAGVLTGVELYLSFAAPARAIVIDLYARPASAPNVGGPAAGDRLLLTDRRDLAALDAIATGGTTWRYVVDFFRPLVIDPAIDYVLRVSCVDALGAPAAMGFARAYGPNPGDAGYPRRNGFYTQQIAPNGWRAFGDGAAPAIRWQSVTRASAAATTARIASIAPRGHAITVGAPLAPPIGGDALAAGTWLHPLPTLQGGLLSAISCHSALTGPVEIVFAEEVDGKFAIRLSLPVLVQAGGNRLLAGGQFDPVALQPGWHIGVRQIGPVVRYGTSLGHSYRIGADGGWTVFRDVTIAVTAEIDAAAPTPTTNARRCRIWREVIGDRAPLGWDVDPAIRYANGLRLTNPAPANSWNIRVHTGRYVRTNRRLTRAVIEWTNAGSVVGLDTIARPNDLIDAPSANSMVLIDGANGRLKIMGTATGAGDPGTRASVALGFPMVVGHRYLLEYGLQDFVHRARLTDLSTSGQSPWVTAGDTDFAGVDTAEGRQVSALAIAFHTGNATFVEIEVLHDAPRPDVAVLGDSISQPVLVTAAQGWTGLLRSAGVEVLVAAQAGGITQSAQRCAGWEVRATAPRYVIAATGANDALLNISTATYRAQLLDIIANARRIGAEIVLPLLHPSKSYTPGPYRAVVQELATATDVHLWRWDIALTLGGDGVTPDPAKLADDELHPTAAGHRALFERLMVDLPPIFD
ncbi:hypothetical protein ASE70_05620 [Sphingomonas sp. Leaf22]|uniref:SGNH/GDSL hydrolase family protein n=1 Tax=Sphingomonas sp. Leaf22 TaxID=1735687 RepID=UPI0006FB0EAE|nr:GDSL-type esterase/lipase family protein [Sphingomonas sp. Leaf22]KQM79347.1 hypothetical protein ASE70_05620 [Sphingomonas sp. Leaf22]